MRKIRTIIVDDELKAREGLTNLIQELEEFELIATCKDGLEAIDIIDKLKPDLILLDIQMPGVSGFDVIMSASHRPMIIFITAYDQFAIKAFEHHALGYLLKPFSDSHFYEALNNAKNLIQGQLLKESLNKLNNFLNSMENNEKDETISASSKLGRLVFRVNGKIILINHEDIRWIEAQDYYIKVHADKEYLIQESLKTIMNSLPPEFIRVHRSSIINIKCLNQLEPIGHSELIAVLKDGTQIKVSRTYKAELMKAL